ncbi:MAG: hypothetical protein L0Z49_03335 [Actinobacteria bacterium]|nr:hypothetical protein [Actinomycetota bacterium]MCI0543465.1 hypothetical protein [Actinomycetota bacterium]MCI0677582.1 hypothetical protein [Actinomycetota bacterium]
MARRSREHRQDIPGYDESRPTRDDRKLKHRATRHATNQILHSVADPEEIVLPTERRTRNHETVNGHHEPERRRFKLWKTRFWKRRGAYREEKAARDSEWPVITPEQLRGD